MMGVLISRQYKHRGESLNAELTCCLVFWRSSLGNLSPRTVPLGQLKPVGAHTDAQGYGHIAAAQFGRSRVAVRLHLPQLMCELEFEDEGASPIFIYELFVAILTVNSADQMRDEPARTCVLCVDNKAAVVAPVNGSSSSGIARALVTWPWNVAAQGTARRRADYVDTESNYADFHSVDFAAAKGAARHNGNGAVSAEFRQAPQSRGAICQAVTMSGDKADF